MLVRGSAKHHIAQLKDGVRDGLRAVKVVSLLADRFFFVQCMVSQDSLTFVIDSQNAIEDGALLPGAGAFFVAAAERLQVGYSSIDVCDNLSLKSAFDYYYYYYYPSTRLVVLGVCAQRAWAHVARRRRVWRSAARRAKDIGYEWRVD